MPWKALREQCLVSPLTQWHTVGMGHSYQGPPGNAAFVQGPPPMPITLKLHDILTFMRISSRQHLKTPKSFLTFTFFPLNWCYNNFFLSCGIFKATSRGTSLSLTHPIWDQSLIMKGRHQGLKLSFIVFLFVTFSFYQPVGSSYPFHLLSTGCRMCFPGSSPLPSPSTPSSVTA